MTRILFILLVALSCIAAANPDPREANLLKSAQLEPTAKVEYLDETGRKLDFAAFFDLVSAGRSVDIDKDGKSSAVFRIAAAKKPAAPAPAKAKAAYKVRVGEAFPKFKLRNGRGKAVSHAAFKGHYTVVNYFFADCGPCIAEVPSLNSFARKHPDTRVLAVTFDEAQVARDFAAKWDFRWPILSEGRVLFDAVGVIAVPVFVLVDPEGRVVAIARSSEIAAPKRQVDETSLAAWIASKRKDRG